MVINFRIENKSLFRKIFSHYTVLNEKTKHGSEVEARDGCRGDNFCPPCVCLQFQSWAVR